MHLVLINNFIERRLDSEKNLRKAAGAVIVRVAGGLWMEVQNKKRVPGTVTQKKLAAPAPFAPLVILITPSQYIRSVFIITLDAHKRRKNTRSLATLTNNAGARSRTPSLPPNHSRHLDAEASGCLKSESQRPSLGQSLPPEQSIFKTRRGWPF
jgi:hypothetical protein